MCLLKNKDKKHGRCDKKSYGEKYLRNLNLLQKFRGTKNPLKFAKLTYDKNLLKFLTNIVVLMQSR